MNGVETQHERSERAQVAIGIVARNEEAGIGDTLRSLFEQSLFEELNRSGWTCEIFCLANGCTDRTAEVVGGIFEAQMERHPSRAAFGARVIELGEGGKINAWNHFVHSASPRAAQYLFLMDSDILIHRRETLWNMLCALRENQEAHIAVDRPVKDIAFKPNKSAWDRLSLAASKLTSSAAAQLCGQLYCIRAEIARKIHLPRDLAACEDGYIKTLVCTDFLTQPSAPGRICLADGAAHIFEAYMSPMAILKNQKRQIMGQTILHLLLDGYLKSRRWPEQACLAETMEARDRSDPGWLKKLIGEHLARTRFWWRLCPNLIGLGFQRLGRLKLSERLVCFPAAVAHGLLALAASWLAFHALKKGCTDYWPQAPRRGMQMARSDG